MSQTNNCQTRSLIIDDEPTIRGLLREFLSESYQCLEAGSAEEALALIREEKFNLVLSDIQMEGMSSLASEAANKLGGLVQVKLPAYSL
jgi:CheY-like chemotaxis protein